MIEHWVIFKCRGDVEEGVEGCSQGFNDGYVIHFSDAAARDAYLSHPDLRATGPAFGAKLDGGLDGLVVFDLDDRA